MAEKYFPFNSVMGDREYLAEDFAAYFADILSSGISANGNNFGVTSAGGLNLSVSSGIALIQGRQYQNTATIQLTVSAGNSNPRIDRVVARLDVSARKILLAVVPGAPQGTPTPPALTRNNDYYEIGLANIAVAASAISLSAANITDTRADNSVCGVVRCLVEKLDVSAFMQNSQTAFNEWFAGVQGILDADTAGNLLNLINTHKSDTTAHITAAERTKWNGGIVTSAERSAWNQKPNPNMLDNWFWKSPVNQRGQTTYSGTPVYSIDRWGITGSTTSLSINSGYLTISGSGGASDASQIGDLRQTLTTDMIAGIIGETVTLSVKCEMITGSKLFLQLANTTKSDYSVQIKAAPSGGMLSVTGTVPSTWSTTDQVRFTVGMLGTTVSAKLYSAKLEIGGVSTLLDSPAPNFAEMLANCQRYQINLLGESGSWVGKGAWESAATKFCIYVPLPVTMRATPACVYIGSSLKITSPSVSPISVDGITLDHIAPNGVTLMCNATSASGEVRLHRVGTIASTDMLMLDANLSI